MPRRIDHLDYRIPNGIEVKRGDLVLIPFRAALIRGVVLSVEEATAFTRVKRIERVLESQYFDPMFIDVLEQHAEQLLQSVASLLYGSIPERPKRLKPELPPRKLGRSFSLKKEEVPYLEQAVSFLEQNHRCFVEIRDMVQAAALILFLRRKRKGRLLVLVPHATDAKHLTRAVRSLVSVEAYDSSLPPKQKTGMREGWKDGSVETVISTRMGSLLFADRADTILLVRSGSADHAQYDRNPRYDARAVVNDWSIASNTPVMFADVLPRTEDLVRFKTSILKDSERYDPQVIDLQNAMRRGMKANLSDELLGAISRALQAEKSVLLSFNRKGIGTRLLCHECGHIAACQSCQQRGTVYEDRLSCHRCGTDSSLPTMCATCGSADLRTRGVGNQRVETALKHLFKHVQVVRIEKGIKPNIDLTRPTIVLGTQYFFESVYDPFAPQSIGLVASLDALSGLSDPHIGATDKTLMRLRELDGIAWRQKAPFYAQAWDAVLLKRILIEPYQILTEEQMLRKRFGYPPYGTLYRVSIRRNRAEEINFTELKDELFERDTKTSIHGPLNHRERVRIEIRTPNPTPDTLSYLKQLPDSVRIEHNPEKS